MGFTREQKVDHKQRAWQLRLAGATQHQIAAQLGVSQPYVCDLLRKMRESLARDAKEIAEEAREEQLGRLDAMTVGVWDKARKGDVKAAELVLKIEDRRSRLLGLDAPTTRAVDLTTGGDKLPAVTISPTAAKL